MTIAPLDSTINFIRRKVRRLTASPSESSLPTSTIDEAINLFYLNDFAYAIKIDQMRKVYDLFTVPYQDTYPIDVNFIQGIRQPVYIDGYVGQLFKDRAQFYNLYPNWPTRFNPAVGTGTQTHFEFTIQGPLVPGQITLGCKDVLGGTIQVADNGKGGLYLQTPNPQVSVPAITSTAPGMYNLNTGNPGQNIQSLIGVVNYQYGTFVLDFPVAPANSQQLVLWVCQYQPGKPYAVLFFNNEIKIRPIPRLVHKITFEVYLTPVQFMESTDHPILNQWAQYIAIGAATKILEDRNDVEGLANIAPLFDRQEALVLERQAVENIGIPNATLFNTPYNPYPLWGNNNAVY